MGSVAGVDDRDHRRRRTVRDCPRVECVDRRRIVEQIGLRRDEFVVDRIRLQRMAQMVDLRELDIGILRHPRRGPLGRGFAVHAVDGDHVCPQRHAAQITHGQSGRGAELLDPRGVGQRRFRAVGLELHDQARLLRIGSGGRAQCDHRHDQSDDDTPRPGHCSVLCLGVSEGLPQPSFRPAGIGRRSPRRGGRSRTGRCRGSDRAPRQGTQPTRKACDTCREPP